MAESNADRPRKSSGRPLTEAEMADWQASFDDIDKCTAAMDESGKMGYNGSNAKTKGENHERHNT